MAILKACDWKIGEEESDNEISQEGMAITIDHLRHLVLTVADIDATVEFLY